MACRICNSEDVARSLQAKEMMLGMGDVFDYDICGACGCMQIREIPEDLARFYPDNYYSFGFTPGSRRDRLESIHNRAVAGKGSLLGRLMDRFFNNRMLESFVRLDVPTSARILDVGCGSGKLLHAIREMGYTETLGVDPFLPEPLQYENGLEIKRCELVEVDGVYDLVMMHHAFEHVLDPRETIQQLSELLESGGQCMLRIPWVECEAFERFGVNWVGLDAPRHLYLYSRKSMALLASEVGMTIEDVYTDGTGMQIWGSEDYEKGMPLFEKQSLAQKLLGFTRKQRDNREADRLNEQGRGDNAVFVLRKS